MIVTDPGSYPESSAAGAIDAEAVLEQTQRVLADPLFRNSKRYSNLLRFVVDRTLKGQTEDLHERTIGIEVFGRSPKYDTSVDPTVRVAATEVRKRLTLYYSEPAREGELRIDLPVRSYVAAFKIKSKVPPEAAPKPSEAIQPVEFVSSPDSASAPGISTRRSGWYIWGSIAGLVLIAGALGLERALAPVSSLDEFWAPFKAASAPILICIGASVAVVPPPVQPSVPSASGVASAEAYQLPPQRGDVPMTDVVAASAMDAFLHAKGKETVLRPAHATSLSDFKSSPGLLIGSFDNEWTMRLGADLHYRFQRESDHALRWIEDASKPGNKDWSVDLSIPQDQLSTDYALVSRIQDPTTGQSWIGIGGLTGLGTLAADQMIVNPAALATITAQLPKGWEHKNVQAVLAIKLVQGSSGVPRVISTYSW